MANNILKELPELVDAKIISTETAENIRVYYQAKNSHSDSRLFLAFGILGSLISGLGIILIIAHNWDDFSRPTKTILGFVPLVLGQLACGFALFKKLQNQHWKEGAATFLFLAIGATISIISQVYHIPGNLSSFLFTWALLGLPLVYLMQSGMASLLYITCITYYATQTGFWGHHNSDAFYFWPMLAAVLPFYYRLYLRKPESNIMYFQNWLLPISVLIALGTVAKSTEEFMFIAYLSLFGLFYHIGNLKYFKNLKRRNNGFLMLGLGGTLALLLFLSFKNPWTGLAREIFKFPETFGAPEFLVAAIITFLATALLFRKYRKISLAQTSLMDLVFLLFILAFIIGYYNPQAGQILINLLVLLLGIETIRKGARQNHLGILNFGLLIITALVACRFFDTDLTFVTRGILFLLVGAGFFIANYYTLKSRKTI
jgi:uncharacterized membrane protein